MIGKGDSDEAACEIDRLREHYARENRGECEHGHLRRQCRICELESQLTEAIAEAKKWRRIRENTHGSCCQCQRCGQDYDECRCTIDSIEYELTEARAEIEGLERDRDRLDWIEANSAWVLTTFEGEWGVWVEATKRCKRPQNLRYAIDAAIASSEAEGGE